jgi:hypothetical protein
LYIEYLFEQYKLNNEKTFYLEAIVKKLAKINNLSLREIDKLFNYLNIILPLSEFFDNKSYSDEILLLFGTIYSVFPLLKIKSSSLFLRFVNGENINDNLVLETDFNMDISDLLDIYNFTNNFYDTISGVIDLNSALYKNQDIDRFKNISRDNMTKLNLVNLLGINKNRTLKFINLLTFTEDFKI